ncbi:MAG TPA: hypothetical protein VGJ00_04655 [Rhabdochlamydiaceae bacterium]|jgi:hypothetical protein
MRYFVLTLLLALCVLRGVYSLSAQDVDKIAERIWKNECAGALEGLTHWNKGENFASLGIGHFIWYAEGQRERFEETFPALLEFLQKRGAVLPAWLKTVSSCPWHSRDAFYADAHSPKMKSLRQFLFDTKSLQALFMVHRLESALPAFLSICPSQEKEKISALFHRLSKDSRGVYALIDYVNFKGKGTASEETYKGKGWGLLQVLQQMPSSSKDPVADFVEAAKALLRQRVLNSPPERHEEKWLKGWFNRLDTYYSNQ